MLSSAPLPPDFLDLIEPKMRKEDFALFRHTLDRTLPPTSIRLNKQKKVLYPLDIGSIFPATQLIPWCNGAYKLSDRPNFVGDPLWHTGYYYVQEASSMAISLIKYHMPEEPIIAIDLCAAPGGKTTLLIDDVLPEGSVLIANEPIHKRALSLVENVQKWGNSHVVVTNAYPDRFACCTETFDLVVVDAPCSGEGMFRKHSHAREEWSLQAVKHCQIRQRSILNDAWKILKPGGFLLYSTCTFNEYENEDNIAYLSALGADVIPLNISENMGIVSGRNAMGYRCYPHLVEGEGFFFCLLRKKKSETYEIAQEKRAKKVNNKQKKPSKNNRSPKNEDAIHTLLTSGWEKENDIYAEEDGSIYVIPNNAKELLLKLADNNIPVLHRGIEVAEHKAGKIRPSSMLAFSLLFDADALPHIEVKKREALSYIAGLSLDIKTSFKGFGSITYKGIPIGLVNAVANRANNLFPKTHRLRADLQTILHEIEKNSTD